MHRYPAITRAITAMTAALVIAILTITVLFAGKEAAGPSVAQAAVTCSLVASPSGSDSNPGTLDSPFRSLAKLDTSLSTGQTGCLRAGEYNEGAVTTLTGSNVTITSYPGERATLHGFVYQGGNALTLSYINYVVDASVLIPWPALCQGAIPGGADVAGGLEVTGSSDIFEHNDFSDSPNVPLTERSGGPGAGFNATPTGLIFRYNRIHDVGFCPVEEHGFYIDATTNTQIYGNWIYNIPAGTGIQVWDHSHGAQIHGNVIDNASSCMDIGSNTSDTTDTTATNNVCSNMFGLQSPYVGYCTNPPGPGCTGPDPGTPLFDFWGGTPGAGNSFTNSTLFCTSGLTHCSTSTADTQGVAVSGNTVADPQFADPNYETSHDYRVSSTSPAASYGLWDGDLGSTSPPTSSSTTSSTTTPTTSTTSTTTPTTSTSTSTTTPTTSTTSTTTTPTSTSTSTTTPTTSTTSTTPTTSSTTTSTTPTTSSTTTTSTTTTTPPPHRKKWRVAFNDTFSGTSLGGVWWPNEYGATRLSITGNVNHDLALNCDDPAQVVVRGGVLRITAVRRACKQSDGVRTWPYASGLVSTDGRFQFTRGWMVARIWMPGRGSSVADWPAWWANGHNWPTTGEIDAVEGLGGKTCWHFHYPGRGFGGSAGPGGCTTVHGAASGWHTYAADWERGSVTFFYDGVRVGRITRGVTSAPMFLILFLQVPRRGIRVPATMRVDYVRVWQFS